MIKKNPQIKKWNIYSGSLTWMSTVSQDQTDGTMKSAYLAKVPYLCSNPSQKLNVSFLSTAT